MEKEEAKFLNKLFTEEFILSIARQKSSKNYENAIRMHLSDCEDRENGHLITKIYNIMSHSYRNEYFYQNTLFNKLVLGKYSLRTTAALRQIPIKDSIADLILINENAVVYEIKTELDTFQRLEKQLVNYQKAFDHVSVVTSEKHFRNLNILLKDSPIGIEVLSSKNTLSKKFHKSSQKNTSQLEADVIFKILRKKEYESVLQKVYGTLPDVRPVFYFDACLDKFRQIPLDKAYKLSLLELKKRNKFNETIINQIPVELKSLCYFSHLRIKDLDLLSQFLESSFKEVI